MTRTALFLIFPLVLAAGCATAPKPLYGEFPDFYPDQVTQGSLSATVRWGGTIIEPRTETDRTCLEVISRELDYELRPRVTDHTRGRFLACREGFLEPAVFQPGRDITVIGRITELSDGRVGEFAYRYPRLDAEVIYLWADAPQVIYIHDPWLYPYYPYHYPYRPYWPHFYHPHRSHLRVHGNIFINR